MIEKRKNDKNKNYTIMENIDEVEKQGAELVGTRYGVALSCGTAALHLAMKLAGIKQGDKVFCTEQVFSSIIACHIVQILLSLLQKIEETVPCKIVSLISPFANRKATKYTRDYKWASLLL